jgi:vibriolysin
MLRRDRWHRSCNSSSAMTSHRIAIAVMSAGLGGCQLLDIGGPTAKVDPNGVPDDVSAALAAMPEAKVLEWTADGHLPTYVVGEMAKVGAMQTDDMQAADTALRQALPPILAPFRLVAGDLVLAKINVDDAGDRHFRYAQTYRGLPVIGGELVVHVDVKGAIFAVNGPARGDLPAELGAAAIGQATAASQIGHDARFAGLATTAIRLVYLETDDGVMHQAYEGVVEGTRGADPARDKVYVDVDTGDIVAVYPQIFFAENRRVYTTGGGTSLPGTLKRSEGQAPSSDVDVNGAYDGTGDAYEAYRGFWNRDSYNNAGGALVSSVHYSTNYCNAYWSGTQMVYGDGDASQGCAPLARSVDVTAHELTHGVTASESGLNYSGESGGMNEAMSDIFGAFVEAWTDGGKTGTLAVSADTWKIGEDVLPPALRFMCDPAADGYSKDVWSSTVGSADVHYSSGVGNLAFCLLAKGGTHPRGKTAVVVPAIGMDKAIRILYKAQTDILTSTAKYATVRTAMQQAATDLGYDQATSDAVGCAWAAVAVGTAPASCGTSGGGSGGGGGGGGGTTTDGTLTSGTPVTGMSDAVNGQKFWKLVVPAGQTALTFTIAGGTGDADLYVQAGAKPTLTSYACRPYKTGNSETCTFSPPAAGTYWVMLNAYAAYAGVTLTGTYSAVAGGGDPVLANGVAVTGVADAAGGAKYWRVTTGANVALTVQISGGSGDADLYTRAGSRPTTSSYGCRPYLTGNAETCNVTTSTAGDTYVMVRGYAAYSGVTLVASY